MANPGDLVLLTNSYSEAAFESASGNATVILESDDELEHGVKVQVRVVADGEEQVVLQTNVEMMQCSSGMSVS